MRIFLVCILVGFVYLIGIDGLITETWLPGKKRSEYIRAAKIIANRLTSKQKWVRVSFLSIYL